MFQISEKGLFEIKFCVDKCSATVLIMACCNSIFVLQGLILKAHGVPNFSNDVLINVFLCVW